MCCTTRAADTENLMKNEYILKKADRLWEKLIAEVCQKGNTDVNA